MGNIYINKDEQIKRANREIIKMGSDVKLVQELSEEEKLIEQKIRREYSLSRELCILRKVVLGILNPNDSKVVAYNNYVVQCIAEVEEESSRNNVQ